MPVVRNIQSLNRIISAEDYGGIRNYIRNGIMGIIKTRGLRLRVDLDALPVDQPVRARVWQGQWIADCECSGAAFVQHSDPVFMCFSCANRLQEGRLRTVQFPPPLELNEIERLLLERPVDDLAGLEDKERAGLAKPLVFVEGRGGLARNWTPDQTVEDLRKEQEKPLSEWHKSLKAK